MSHARTFLSGASRSGGGGVDLAPIKKEIIHLKEEVDALKMAGRIMSNDDVSLKPNHSEIEKKIEEVNKHCRSIEERQKQALNEYKAHTDASMVEHKRETDKTLNIYKSEISNHKQEMNEKISAINGKMVLVDSKISSASENILKEVDAKFVGQIGEKVNEKIGSFVDKIGKEIGEKIIKKVDDKVSSVKEKLTLTVNDRIDERLKEYQLDKVKTEISTLQTEANTLKSNMGSMKDEIVKDNEEKLSTMSKFIHSQVLSKTNAVVDEGITPLKEEMEELKQQVAMCDVGMKKLNDRVSTISITGTTPSNVESEIKGLRDELVNDTEQKLSTMSKFIHSQVLLKVNDAVNIMREDVSGVKEDVGGMREHISSLREENKQDISSMREELSSMREENNEKINSVREENKQELSSMREENKQHISSVREDVSNTKQELSSLREENKQELSSLREDVSNTKQELSSLREENKQELSSLREENKQELSSMREENNQKMDTIQQTMREELSSMREENKQEISSMREDVSNTKQELSSMREENKQHISSVREDVSNTKQELSSMREENKQHISSMREDVSNTKQELSSMREENKQEISSMREKISKYETNIIQYQKNIIQHNQSTKQEIYNLRETTKQGLSTLKEDTSKLITSSIERATQDFSNSLQQVKEKQEEDHKNIQMKLSLLAPSDTQLEEVSTMVDSKISTMGKFIHSQVLSSVKQDLSSLNTTIETTNDQTKSYMISLHDTTTKTLNTSLLSMKDEVLFMNQKTLDEFNQYKSHQSNSMSLLKDTIDSSMSLLDTKIDNSLLFFKEELKTTNENLHTSLFSLKQELDKTKTTFETELSSLKSQQPDETLLSSFKEEVRTMIKQEQTHLERLQQQVQDIEKWIPKEPNVKMVVHTEPPPSKIPKPKPIEIPKDEPATKTFRPKSAVVQPKPKPPSTPSKSPSTESSFKARLAEILQQELSKYKLTQYETIQSQLQELLDFKNTFDATHSKYTELETTISEIKSNISREFSERSLSTKTQFGTITEDILKHIERILSDIANLKEQMSTLQTVPTSTDDELVRTKLSILTSTYSQVQENQIETEQRWLKHIDHLKTECASILTSTNNQHTRLCEYKVELGNLELIVKQLQEEQISKFKQVEDQLKSFNETQLSIQKEIKQLQSLISTIKDVGLQTSTRLDQMEIREKEREEQTQQQEQQRMEKDKERQQFNELLLEKLRQMKTDIATQIKTTSKDQKDKYDALLIKHAELDTLYKELSSTVSGLSQHQAHIDEKLTVHLAKYEQEMSSLNTKHQSVVSQHKEDVDKHTTYLANLREELSKQEQTIQTESNATKQSLRQMDSKYSELQRDIQSQLQKERQSLYEKYVDQQVELEKQIKSQMTQIQISLHDNTKYMKVNLEQQMKNKEEDVFQLKQQVQQLQKQIQTLQKSQSAPSVGSFDLESIKPMIQSMIQPIIQSAMSSVSNPRHTSPEPSDMNTDGFMQEVRTIKNEIILIKRRLKYLEDHTS